MTERANDSLSQEVSGRATSGRASSNPKAPNSEGFGSKAPSKADLTASSAPSSPKTPNRRAPGQGTPGGAVTYFAGSAVVVGALYILSKALPSMPAWGIALAWALMSILPAIGLSYHWVIRKTFNQGKFKEGGYGGRFNRGRVVCLLVCFVLAAIAMACLLVECPKWDATMWAIIVLAVPVYFGVSLFVRKLLGGEYAPLFVDSRTAMWSAVVVGVLLCIVYAALLFLFPSAEYARVVDAFLAQSYPFEGSPSAIMTEYGKIVAVVDGLKAYALSKTAEGSFSVYILLHLVFYAGMFFGISSLLATCSIHPHELGRVFAKIGAVDSSAESRTLLKRYVVLSALLPLALAVGFVAADARAAEVVKTEAYSMAEEFARGQVSLAVRIIDGKKYDPEGVEGLLARAGSKSQALADEQKQELTKLINASFDARVANVDAYLDWYYRPFADWEALFREFTGSAEDFMNEQFIARINEGIDDSAIDSALDDYQRRAEDLKADTLEELSEYEITEDYPDWLIVEVEEGESFTAQLDLSLEPVDTVLTAKQRLGISAAAGTIGQLIAKKILSKAAGKTAFKTLLGRAAAVLGAVGGPAGIALSVAGTVFLDVLLQKGEEAVNRESYKQEIISSIEEQRAETLAAIGA